MKQKSYREVLDLVAADFLEEQASLWPQIAPKIGRKTFMMTLRARPVLAILVALLILLALSGVAYALGRSLGYIPGLGVVDQNSQFYILAGPVSQTRDGVTVTVEKAVLNTNDLLIVFKVEGLSSDKFSFLEPLNTCAYPAELRLLTGEVVKAGSGGSELINGGVGFEDTHRYSPIPTNTQDATLIIPCIQGALAPDALPENWELPLRFIPATPDMVMTMMPVTEIVSTTVSSTTTTEMSPLSNSNMPAPIAITQVIDAGDSYILVGEDHPVVSSGNGEIQPIDWILTDGSGQPFNYQIPSGDMDLDGKTLLSDPHLWAVQFTKNLAPPIHITHRYRDAFPADPQGKYVFEFDAGANPQDQQVWNFNQDFQLAGHAMRLISITADNMPVPFDGSPSKYAYRFDFQTDDPAVNSLTVNIDGYASNRGDPRNNYPNNYAEGDPLTGKFTHYLSWPQMPTGKLQVIFSNLLLNGEIKNWTIDWQP